MLKLFKKSSLKTINKATLDNELETFKSCGITGDDKDLIVSLTSFPQRMYELHYTLYSLLTQNIKPGKIILWLAEEEFPHLEKDIPKKVLNLRNNGLEIKWCNNIYSYKKLIPALKNYPDNIIVTADDDIFYENDWLEKLILSHEKDKKSIICHRAHKIKFTKEGVIASYKNWAKKIRTSAPSYFNFSTGAGGVLYPPHCLYKDILNEKLFMEFAPKADDVWFWAMALLNGTKTSVAQNCTKQLTYINPERERGLTNELTLFQTNKKGGNDLQLEKVINHYPQILDILKETE